MPLGATVINITPEQLALLQRYPRHTQLLKHLGIAVPPDGLVLVSKTGIRILVPHRPVVVLQAS